MADTTIKCTSCKRFSNISDFKKNGKVLKMCIKCRMNSIKSRNKNKCIHNRQKNNCIDCHGSNICEHIRQKSHCVECGGSSICEHKRIKSICVDCHGSNICEHNRQKSHCVECCGSSICIHKKQKLSCKQCGDEIKITIQTMIKDSKHSDKKHNRYDIVNFIDKCFVKNLIEDCKDKCYYCQCDLQYMVRQRNLATIERLDNSIGHIKSNVVIACFHCNCKKVGNKLN